MTDWNLDLEFIRSLKATNNKAQGKASETSATLGKSVNVNPTLKASNKAYGFWLEAQPLA